MLIRILKTFTLCALLLGTFIAAASVAYAHPSTAQSSSSPSNESATFFDDSHVHEIDVLSGTLFVNEFMADNDTTLQDPQGTGFPDWIELYNAGATDIDLQGMYLTDDLTAPTKHAITQTLIVPANGHLVIFADNDPDQGTNHLTFKLSSLGEQIGIFDSDGSTLIDSYTFGVQSSDVSEGRCPDGGATWEFFTTPTPGTANASCKTPTQVGLVALQTQTPTTPMLIPVSVIVVLLMGTTLGCALRSRGSKPHA